MVKKSKSRIWFEKTFGKTVPDIIFNSINYILFAFLLFVCFYPFYHVLKKSLVVNKLVNNAPTKIISIESYIKILENDGRI